MLRWWLVTVSIYHVLKCAKPSKGIALLVLTTKLFCLQTTFAALWFLVWVIDEVILSGNHRLKEVNKLAGHMAGKWTWIQVYDFVLCVHLILKSAPLSTTRCCCQLKLKKKKNKDLHKFPVAFQKQGSIWSLI